MAEKQSELWDKLIEKTEREKDSKIFWKNIHKVRGSKPTLTPYLVKNDGTKAHTKVEKKAKLRCEWKNIFKI